MHVLVKVKYDDETTEDLVITADSFEAAEAEAESWVDTRKNVWEITVVEEVHSGPRRHC